MMLDVAEIITTALHEHEGAGDTSYSATTADILAALGDPDSITPYTHTSKSLSLVSFRCMLQDTGYPMEVYLPGHAPTEGDVDWSKLKERWVGWGVEVPGETYAAKAAPAASQSLNSDFAHLGLNGSSPSHPPVLQAKFPLPDQKKDYLGALIKVYDDSLSFKPASTHTFIGLLSSAGLPSPLSADDAAGDEREHITVPTIHVLQAPHPPAATADLPDPINIRSALVQYLSKALNIDGVSAEYILLALLASPSVRPPALAPLGTLSLNLIGSPPDLPSILSNLVPALVDLPLTLDTLHNTPFNPSASSSADSSLSSGLLQLAEGTVLIIDERAMGDGGKLEEKAVKNLQAFTECLAEQKVRYEYPYMDGLKMEAWIRPIVLSDGKSLVPVDIHLPVASSTSSASPSSASATSSSSSSADLPAFRTYLQKYGSLAHARTLSIPDDIASIIQDDFVSHRRESQSSGGGAIDAEAILKRRMKIARLVAVSYPDAVLTRERWDRVVQMDETAEERMKERQRKVGKGGAGANGTR